MLFTRVYDWAFHILIFLVDCGYFSGDLDVQSVTSLGAGENVTIPEDSESSMKPEENFGFSGQIPSGIVSRNHVENNYL